MTREKHDEDGKRSHRLLDRAVAHFQAEDVQDIMFIEVTNQFFSPNFSSGSGVFVLHNVHIISLQSTYNMLIYSFLITCYYKNIQDNLTIHYHYPPSSPSFWNYYFCHYDFYCLINVIINDIGWHWRDVWLCPCTGFREKAQISSVYLLFSQQTSARLLWMSNWVNINK